MNRNRTKEVTKGLENLVRHGFVEMTIVNGEPLYSLTEKGKKFVENMKDEETRTS